MGALLWCRLLGGVLFVVVVICLDIGLFELL